ncbi:hypothetical protein D9M72_611570 [compost metagenome]
MAPIADQRCEHDRRGNGRLAILLGNQKKEIRDQPLCILGVVSAKDGSNEIENPFLRRLSERRPTGYIDDAE